MIRPIACGIALCLVPVVSAPQAPAVSKFVVAGVPVILKHITANDVIAVQLYIRGGSTVLTTATAGVERLMGEALTHGTTNYTKDQFAALATSTGTEIGARADYDYTVITAQAVRQNWEAAWDLITEAVFHPTFPAAEVEVVRNQVLNDLRQRTDNPDAHLTLLADSTLYAGHAYAAHPEGTPASIGAISRDALAQWHRRRLTKENLLLVVVGNVTRDDLTRKVAAACGGLPATGGGAPRATPLVASKGAPVTARAALPTNYIMGVFAAPAPGHPDYPAMRVAMRVLSDRLFEEVRTRRNLAYAVAATLAARAANRGALYVTAVSPETTLKVIFGEVRRLQDAPVSPSLLRETISVFATEYWMDQQTNMGQGTQLALWELNGGGWRNASRYVDRLRGVTPADVQRVAKAYVRDVHFIGIGQTLIFPPAPFGATRF